MSFTIPPRVTHTSYWLPIPPMLPSGPREPPFSSTPGGNVRRPSGQPRPFHAVEAAISQTRHRAAQFTPTRPPPIFDPFGRRTIGTNGGNSDPFGGFERVPSTPGRRRAGAIGGDGEGQRILALNAQTTQGEDGMRVAMERGLRDS